MYLVRRKFGGLLGNRFLVCNGVWKSWEGVCCACTGVVSVHGEAFFKFSSLNQFKVFLRGALVAGKKACEESGIFPLKDCGSKTISIDEGERRFWDSYNN